MVTTVELSLKVLLYRYLFFEWLFRDVSRGSHLERAAAWRHNLSQAHWLFTYLRRWIGLTIIFYALGQLTEHGLQGGAFSAVFYVGSAVSVAVNAVIGVAIAGFKMLPGP